MINYKPLGLGIFKHDRYNANKFDNNNILFCTDHNTVGTILRYVRKNIMRFWPSPNNWQSNQLLYRCQH